MMDLEKEISIFEGMRVEFSFSNGNCRTIYDVGESSVVQ